MGKSKILTLRTLKPMFFFFMFLTLIQLNGASVNWIGGNGSWHDPSGWDTGAVPGQGDNVVIPSGTVSVNSGEEEYARSVIVDPGARLNVNAGSMLIIADTHNQAALRNQGRVYVYGKLLIEDVEATNGEANGILNEYRFYVFSNGWVGIFDVENTGIMNEANSYLWNFNEIEIGNLGEHGVENQGVIRNYNKINISASNNYATSGVINGNQFWNYSSGELTINGGGSAGFSNVNSNSYFFNYGEFLSQNSNQVGINNSGLVQNSGTGMMEIKYADNSGFYNSGNGSLINYGNLQIRYSGFAGIFNSGEVTNNHFMDIYQSQIYGLDCYTGSNFYNNGTLYLQNTNNIDLVVYSNFQNNTEGMVFINSAVYLLNSAEVVNDGVMVSGYESNHIFNSGSQFTNNGIIEDLYDAFPSSINNQQVIVKPLNGPIQAGVPYQNALDLGSLSDVTVSTWSDGLNGPVAGSYNSATNTFTPNSNAIGLDELRVIIELNSTGFARSYTVMVPDGISFSSAVQSDTYNFLSDGNVEKEVNELINEVVTAYPNPTRGALNIESNLFINQATEVLIMASNGTEAGRMFLPPGANNSAIDLPANLTNGMYILKFYQKGRPVGTSKVQLQR